MIKKIKIVDSNGAILIDDTLFSPPIKEESILYKKRIFNTICFLARHVKIHFLNLWS